MKHVFIINSHTAFLTAIGTISFLKLDSIEVLFLLVRNYKNDDIPKEVVVYDVSSLSFESERVFNRRNFCRRPKMAFVDKVDSFINDIIGEAYHLYAPHLAHPLWTIMYTNDKCEYFSYIQEGYIPFKKAYVVKPTTKGKIENFFYDRITNGRVWFYRPWYLKEKIKDHSKIDAFAINNSFFSYLPAKCNIIKWPLPKENIDLIFPRNHTIFIYDAFVTHNLIRSKDYISMCKILIDEQATEHNYLKFHPGQSEEEKKKIISYFQLKNLKYTVLENSIPFEYVLMTQKELRLVGYGSSLLFLAHDYGHEVICEDDRLMTFKLYSRYRNFYGFMSFKEYISQKS